MATETSLETIGHTPEEVGSRIAPRRGPEKPPGTPGRPAVPLRRLCEGSRSGRRPGGQWSPSPRPEDAPQATVGGRCQPGVEAGVFEPAGRRGLVSSAREFGLDGQGQAVAGGIPQAPRGGAAPGPRPVARATAGTNRRGRSEGRGAPLAGVLAGATAPDKPLGRETGDRPAVERPEQGVSRWPPLSRAAGDTSAAVSAGSLARDSLLQLRPPARAELAGAPEKT